ncbi:MAG: hemolysin family protein [Acidimicrobiales bacterium]
MLILATAFFVAAEFAVVATDRSRLETLAGAGSRSARTALAVHRRLSFHLSGAQLGLTVVSLVLGFIAEPTLAQVIEPIFGGLSDAAATGISVGIALAIATGLSMVVGELIPKNLVLARPEQAALLLARPLRFFSMVLSPVIKVSNGTANRLVRAMGIEPQEELASVRTIEDLASIVRSSKQEGTLAGARATLLTRSIRFGEKTAADALVPRMQIEALDRHDTLADLVARSVETGKSRFPVTGTDIDHLVGVVHVKDVYRVPIDLRATTQVESIMGEPLAVPETRPLEDLFGELRTADSHLAIVVDEYGGTSGIVSLEDLLEEIVGEIDDEYDPPTAGARFDSRSGTWFLAGTLHGDEVREACGLLMPDGEYDTLAGFVLERLGHVPAAGETVVFQDWTLTVERMDNLRIAVVGLRRRDRPDPATRRGRPAGAMP